ncbi:MAG TPA: adenylate/guanylate cyclase domain-containing protein, partial [Candidatus Limnocylindria bacterium]|nr:adenylate/guanylate cyclase domain-containing protein [Candidatus Limnocylindria bacterium]
MQICPGCGESNPGRFRECAFCGQPLTQPRESREERKVLTVVFCDLKGSTSLGEQLDPESLSEVLELYFTAMTRVLERHGGQIQKFIGDAIVAAFGIPLLHEDDALRAVRAAVEMRDSLARLNVRLQTGYGVELQARIGVHTGEVLVRTAADGQNLLTGDTMNTAARLEQYAGEDEVLIGGPTYRLVRDAVEAEPLEPLELRGKAEAVAAYRMLRVFGDEQSARRHDAPIVGRDAELATLVAAYERARQERRPVLATVLGDAGVGKSRLVRALLEATAEEAAILRSRCLPYGEGITFLPLLGLVRDAAGIAVEDSPEVAAAKLQSAVGDQDISRRLASAFGWSKEALPVAEVFWAARGWLQVLSADQPAVVVIDDVQWAEPVLLELIEHLLAEAHGAPVLLLCTARPDMLERLPEWSESERASRLLLDRLPDEATGQVIANLVGGVELPADVTSQILRSAEGNPLYVEQLISMLVDGGLLARENGHWQARGSLSEIQVPPSIDALLTARLDRLAAEERQVIEPAAVIGLEFFSGALRDLVPEGSGEAVTAQLSGMQRKRLVRPATDSRLDLDDYRFHHVLIRDAAYGRALKRTRAQLHERFADWLEAWDRGERRAGEYDEIVGYHLEQAFIYGSQLGPTDEQTRSLGRRAADNLAAAGQRAFVQGDLPAAVNLLGRAVAALPELDPARLALLPDLAEATMETGDFERALEILRETETPEARAANEPAVARAELIRLLIDYYAGSEEAWGERVQAATASAIAIFEAAGDEVGLATAWRMRSGMEGSALRFDRAVSAAEKVVDHAQRAGDVRQERRGAVAYALSALYGPTPVQPALARCRELVAAVEGDRRSQGLILLCVAQLVAMTADIEQARTDYRAAQQMLVQLGHGVFAASTSLETARVELLAGDLQAAEELLRNDYAALESLGEKFVRSTIGALLARTLILKGG